MRNLLIIGIAVLALALFGCGSNSAGDITGPAGQKTSGSGSTDDNIIGPPTRTELDARKPVPHRLDDPRDENIIGPPVYTDFDK